MQFFPLLEYIYYIISTLIFSRLIFYIILQNKCILYSQKETYLTLLGKMVSPNKKTSLKIYNSDLAKI